MLQRWQCTRREDLVIRRWPEGCVVFDEASGDLHALTPVASEVLALLLQQRSWSISELLAELLGPTPDDGTIAADDAESMSSMLRHFFSLDLVEQTAA